METAVLETKSGLRSWVRIVAVVTALKRRRRGGRLPRRYGRRTQAGALTAGQRAIKPADKGVMAAPVRAGYGLPAGRARRC